MHASVSSADRYATHPAGTRHREYISGCLVPRTLGEGEGPAASERATTMPEQRRGVVVASSEAGARM